MATEQIYISAKPGYVTHAISSDNAVFPALSAYSWIRLHFAALFYVLVSRPLAYYSRADHAVADIFTRCVIALFLSPVLFCFGSLAFSFKKDEPCVVTVA